MMVAGCKDVKSQEDQMKCPKCGRFELRDNDGEVQCRICGYALSPGEGAKFRLFKLLREESKSKR